MLFGEVSARTFYKREAEGCVLTSLQPSPEIPSINTKAQTLLGGSGDLVQYLLVTRVIPLRRIWATP